MYVYAWARGRRLPWCLPVWVLSSCIVSCRSYTFTLLYCMAENIGGELNLANWRSVLLSILVNLCTLFSSIGTIVYTFWAWWSARLTGATGISYTTLYSLIHCLQVCTVSDVDSQLCFSGRQRPILSGTSTKLLNRHCSYVAYRRQLAVVLRTL